MNPKTLECMRTNIIKDALIKHEKLIRELPDDHMPNIEDITIGVLYITTHGSICESTDKSTDKSFEIKINGYMSMSPVGRLAWTNTFFVNAIIPFIHNFMDSINTSSSESSEDDKKINFCALALTLAILSYTFGMLDKIPDANVWNISGDNPTSEYNYEIILSRGDDTLSTNNHNVVLHSITHDGTHYRTPMGYYIDPEDPENAKYKINDFLIGYRNFPLYIIDLSCKCVYQQSDGIIHQVCNSDTRLLARSYVSANKEYCGHNKPISLGNIQQYINTPQGYQLEVKIIRQLYEPVNSSYHSRKLNDIKDKYLLFLKSDYSDDEIIQLYDKIANFKRWEEGTDDTNFEAKFKELTKLDAELNAKLNAKLSAIPPTVQKLSNRVLQKRNWVPDVDRDNWVKWDTYRHFDSDSATAAAQLTRSPSVKREASEEEEHRQPKVAKNQPGGNKKTTIKLSRYIKERQVAFHPTLRIRKGALAEINDNIVEYALHKVVRGRLSSTSAIQSKMRNLLVENVVDSIQKKYEKFKIKTEKMEETLLNKDEQYVHKKINSYLRKMKIELLGKDKRNSMVLLTVMVGKLVDVACRRSGSDLKKRSTKKNNKVMTIIESSNVENIKSELFIIKKRGLGGREMIYIKK